MKRKSIIVMGVSGSGKSTIGYELALALNAKFIDGDDLHPKENILKMASGQPLNDDDRTPWLRRINDASFSLESRNENGVIICSALKKKYREQIREGNKHVIFLFLDGTKELIINRIHSRKGHFMKEEMLYSQFSILERPDNEPNTIVINIDNSIESIITQAITEITKISEHIG